MTPFLVEDKLVKLDLSVATLFKAGSYETMLRGKWIW